MYPPFPLLLLYFPLHYAGDREREEAFFGLMRTLNRGGGGDGIIVVFVLTQGRLRRDCQKGGGGGGEGVEGYGRERYAKKGGGGMMLKPQRNRGWM